MGIHLQACGHQVVGIDVSSLDERVCRERGILKAKVLPVDRVGPALGVFDTIVMMGNNFGVAGDRVKGSQLLRRFHGITTASARIIPTGNDIHRTEDPVHLAYQRLNRRRGGMPGQIRLASGTGLDARHGLTASWSRHKR